MILRDTKLNEGITDSRIRTHPGEVLLEEFLKPLGLSAHSLSLAIGVPPTRIADIVHQRRGISADTAARLARYFGTTAEFWCNLQSSYELSGVAANKQQDLAHISRTSRGRLQPQWRDHERH